jgi:uncharacterized protein YvpB
MRGKGGGKGGKRREKAGIVSHDLWYFGGVIIWGLITMYFTQKSQGQSINGIGNKLRGLEGQVLSDRMVDIACTKEFEVRMWKVERFLDEVKR